VPTPATHLFLGCLVVVAGKGQARLVQVQQGSQVVAWGLATLLLHQLKHLHNIQGASTQGQSTWANTGTAACTMMQEHSAIALLARAECFSTSRQQHCVQLTSAHPCL
jgi:hypothetical protein